MAQSNDNADCVDVKDRFKFVDDLSFVEIIFILNMGLSSYNVRAHVPSNVPIHNQIIQGSKLKSQSQLESINEWTKSKKMKLNIRKTKNMLFNFNKKHQFSTKLSLMNEDIEMVHETKLLGTIITDQITCDRNTEEITKKAFRRMQLLNTAATFTSKRKDLSISHAYFRYVSY